MEKGEILAIIGTFLFALFALSWSIKLVGVEIGSLALGTIVLLLAMFMTESTWARRLAKTAFIVPLLIMMIVLIWEIINKSNNSFYILVILTLVLEVFLVIKSDKAKNGLVNVFACLLGFAIYYGTAGLMLLSRMPAF